MTRSTLPESGAKRKLLAPGLSSLLSNAVSGFLVLLLLALLLLGGCAASPSRPSSPPLERVSAELWRRAQATAEEIGNLDPASRLSRTVIMYASKEELCARFGRAGRCPHAAVHQRFPRTASAVLWLDESRPWSSDPDHTFGILVHEAAHGWGVDEPGAHAIQASYLRNRRRRPDLAARVLANLPRATNP